VEPIFRNLSGHGVMTMDVSEENHILEYQWRMLQDNPIDGLLPLSCLHRDGKSLLSWRTTSLQPLSLMFERRCWDISDLLHLVRQLFRILSAMDAQMLDPWRLLLDNRFILIEPVALIVNFAYLPLSGMTESGNPTRELLQKWVMGECRLSGGGDSLALSALVSKLNDQGFQWRHLAGICPAGGHLPGTAGIMQAGEDFGQPVCREADPPVVLKQKPFSGPAVQKPAPMPEESSAELQGNPYGRRLAISLRIPSGRRESHPDKNEVSNPDDNWNRKGNAGLIFLLLQAAVVLILVAAAAGGSVLTQRGIDGLSAWSGLALVVGALEVLAFTKRAAKSTKEDKPGKVSGKWAGLPSDKHAMTARPVLPVNKPYQGLAEPRMAGARGAGPPLHEQDHGIFSLSGGMAANMAAVHPDRTERLAVANGRFLLHRREDGKMSRIEIVKLPFLLGRMRGYVDGCLEHPAVGKIHAELREGPEGLFLVDLNSRNGTRINGISLEPYHEAPLGQGDVLRIANEELIYDSGAGRFSDDGSLSSDQA